MNDTCAWSFICILLLYCSYAMKLLTWQEKDSSEPIWKGPVSLKPLVPGVKLGILTYLCSGEVLVVWCLTKLKTRDQWRDQSILLKWCCLLNPQPTKRAVLRVLVPSFPRNLCSRIYQVPTDTLSTHLTDSIRPLTSGRLGLQNWYLIVQYMYLLL